MHAFNSTDLALEHIWTWHMGNALMQISSSWVSFRPIIHLHRFAGPGHIGKWHAPLLLVGMRAAPETTVGLVHLCVTICSASAAVSRSVSKLILICCLHLPQWQLLWHEQKVPWLIAGLGVCVAMSIYWWCCLSQDCIASSLLPSAALRNRTDQKTVMLMCSYKHVLRDNVHLILHACAGTKNASHKSWMENAVWCASCTAGMPIVEMAAGILSHSHCTSLWIWYHLVVMTVCTDDR